MDSVNGKRCASERPKRDGAPDNLVDDSDDELLRGVIRQFDSYIVTGRRLRWPHCV